MKNQKLVVVGKVSLGLLGIALFLLLVAPSIGEWAGSIAIESNGGSMNTSDYRYAIETAKETTEKIAYLLSILGIGGIFMATNKWLNE